MMKPIGCIYRSVFKINFIWGILYLISFFILIVNKYFLGNLQSIVAGQLVLLFFSVAFVSFHTCCILNNALKLIFPLIIIETIIGTTFISLAEFLFFNEFGLSTISGGNLIYTDSVLRISYLSLILVLTGFFSGGIKLFLQYQKIKNSRQNFVVNPMVKLQNRKCQNRKRAKRFY